MNWSIKTRIQERSSTDCTQPKSWLVNKDYLRKAPLLPADKESAATLPASREMRERKRAEIALAKARNFKEAEAAARKNERCSPLLLPLKY